MGDAKKIKAETWCGNRRRMRSTVEIKRPSTERLAWGGRAKMGRDIEVEPKKVEVRRKRQNRA